GRRTWLHSFAIPRRNRRQAPVVTTSGPAPPRPRVPRARPSSRAGIAAGRYLTCLRPARCRAPGLAATAAQAPEPATAATAARAPGPATAPPCPHPTPRPRARTGHNPRARKGGATATALGPGGQRPAFTPAPHPPRPAP